MSEVVLMLPNGPSLGNRQLTRPTLIDIERRVLVSYTTRGITNHNVSGMQHELQAKEKLPNLNEEDKIDVMEKGMNVATV